MYTIYLDTHFINLVVALFKDGILIDKKVVESNQHSFYTVNLLSSMLNDNNISISDIKDFIVINGPGSFTGVRIGVVIAKMFGYTKNVELRALSYLEAMALNYDRDVVVGIKDRNGVFIGEFNSKHEILGDYFYLSNKEFLEYNKDVVMDVEIDLEKVYKYVMEKDAINPHLLKPLYVKKIEVQYD